MQAHDEDLSSTTTEQMFSLRILPINQITPHEHLNPKRVARLATHLHRNGTLINPVITVEWQNLYVILDGTTRIAAFQQLGYRHIVAQIISAENEKLELRAWNHSISGLKKDKLLDCLHNVSDCILTAASQNDTQFAVNSGEALCGIIVDNDQGYIAQASHGVDRVTALNSIVDSYTDTSSINRTISTDFSTASSELPDISALVLFPKTEISRVLQDAIRGRLLPSGITRFIVPNRVLRLNANLSHIFSEETLKDKNAWLDSLLSDKQMRGNVRYYQEGVIILDE